MVAEGRGLEAYGSAQLSLMMWVWEGRGLEAVWQCTVVLDDVGVGGEGVGGSMAVHTIVLDDVGVGGKGEGQRIVSC